MSWRPAKSLVVLRDQVNAAYPNRSKASDGLLGDPAHAARNSDHNPNSNDVVCGMDLTHDPKNGFDANVFTEAQRKNPHPNLKYMVWRGQIASRIHNWVWRPSSGHFQHVHISVGVGGDGNSRQPYDDTDRWDIGIVLPEKPPTIVDLGDNMKKATLTVHIGKDGKGWKDIHTGSQVSSVWTELNSSDPRKRFPGFEGVVTSSQIRGSYAVVVVEGAKPNTKFDVNVFWTN